MDVADIITEFGAYYINQGQNMQRLIRQLRQPSTTDALFTPIMTDDTVWRASETRIGRVLQPFQKAWTPLGDVEFVPVAIEQYKLKMDNEDYPDDLEASWLGFLSGPEIDRKQWPFIRWFIEVELLPQLQEDYELHEVYNGEYAAPTPGTAGAVSTSMNGIKKIINDHIDAGRITPIVTGALSADPATLVDQIEAFADAIDNRYWRMPLEVAVAPEIERRFFRGYKAKYGQYTDYRENTQGVVDMTNLTIVGKPSMIGSGKIWTTPKRNAVLLQKKTANMTRVQVENVDRLVKVYTDFWKGVGFLIPEIVFTNDQDLTVI